MNGGNGAGREMTFGEKAVGLTFNPSADPIVDDLKKTYAHIIDVLNGIRSGPDTVSSERARLLSVAITEAQGAQMWAVKATTFRT